MTLFVDAVQVESQLSQMGTSIDGLLKVVRAAGAGVASTTNYHPMSAPGTYGYHEGTAALRRLLVPIGYEYDEEHKQPRTYSPSRGVSIIIQGGDENTGADTGIEPRSRNAHGGVTAQKIKQNAAQLLLPFSVPTQPSAEREAEQDGPVMMTWVLLIAVIEEALRAELSLPQSFEAGKVTGWVHRILLPEQPFGSTHSGSDVGDDEGPEDEVAVEWK